MQLHRQCCVQHQAVSPRPSPVITGPRSFSQHRLVAYASDDQSNSLTPEEAAIYEEVLARRRSERQQAIQEAKRRSRFNPLQGKASQQPDGPNKAKHGQAQQQPPAPQAANPATAKLDTASKQGTQPAPAKGQAPASQGSHQAMAKSAPQPTSSSPSSVKNERAARSLLRQGRLPRAGTAGLARRAAALAQQRGRLRSGGRSNLEFDSDDDESDDDDDQVDQDELAALEKLAQQLLAGEKPAGLEDAAASVPVRGSTKSSSKARASPATSSPALGSSRGVPQQKAAASAGGGAKKQRISDLNDPRLLAQLQALMEADSDSDSDDDVDQATGQKREKMVNMDDIDWEALEKYESFEAALESGTATVRLTESDILVPDKVKQLGQQGAAGSSARPPVPPSSSTSATTFKPQPLFKSVAPSAVSTASPSSEASSTASSSQQAPSQSQQQQGGAPPRQPTSTTLSSTASAQKPASSTSPQGPIQPPQQQAASPSKQGSKPQGLQTKAGAKASSGQPATGKTSGSVSSSRGTSSEESGMDLALLEELLLGKDWQQRELSDLVGQAKDGPSSSGSSSGNAQEEEDNGEEVWGDEVTSMLVSLALMSHKRYCKEPLLPEDLAEEQRARAMWEAPFVVLVQDDSKQAMLEYANKEGLKMLGISDFVDIYDLSSYSIVDASEEQQQEWLWAVAEAEDKPERRATIPRLRFTQRGGATVEAKDAVVFRIDSLEGGPVGVACVIRDWKVVA